LRQNPRPDAVTALLEVLMPSRNRSAGTTTERPTFLPEPSKLGNRGGVTTMNETLRMFEALAGQAKSGDGSAEAKFFSEAARLFPADFAGEGSASAHAEGGTAARIDQALALIRQTLGTGG